MYLKSIEYFRAIAIIQIVMGHSYGISGFMVDTVLHKTLANIITGGTALFVFISGFLFHQVFAPKFNYRRFLQKKVRNVLLPYLICSFFGILYALYIHGPNAHLYFGPSNTLFDQVIRPSVLYLLTGGEFFAYWYIPFIMVVFLCSPLHLRFIHVSRTSQLFITLGFFLAATVIQRPVDNLSVLQSVLVFTPFYLLGILCSAERERIYRILAAREGWLFAGVLLLALTQALTMDAAGLLHKAPFLFHGFDINVVQKALLCLFFMVFLHRFEQSQNPLLTALASSSFAIFFIHCAIILALIPLARLYASHGGFYLLPVISLGVVGLSYLIARLIKGLFPRHSRMVIGW